MARPTKEFLDYFPLYCRGDERTDLLKAKKGMAGFGVYISLLIKLYGEKGYYLDWNETICCIFANSIGMPEEAVADIVLLLVKIGIFEKNVFDNYGVLTSKEIQENYLFAISKRKNKSIDNRYKLVSVEKTQVSGEETPVSVTESTQIKENKRKENKIKENKIIEKECRGGYHPPAEKQSPLPTPAPRGEMKNVILTDGEYEQLKAKCPDADELIDNFSLYLASSGKSYSSHYATLVRWAKQDNAEGAQSPAKGSYNSCAAPTNKKAAVPKRESSFEDSFELDEFLAAAVRRGQNLFPTESKQNQRTPEGVRG